VDNAYRNEKQLDYSFGVIMFTVYIHRNKINNKLYIGQTCQKPKYRWNSGKGYVECPYFYSAIKKYGWDNFEHIIWATNLTQYEANEMEKSLIALYNTTNTNYGYNLALGGKNSHLTEKIKNKIGLKGDKHPMFGKHHSVETREKLKNSLKGNKCRPTKPVYCIELNKAYVGAVEASINLNIDISSIAKCCKGKKKSAGGYHWRYI
jgi:group I intron endonuclease